MADQGMIWAFIEALRGGKRTPEQIDQNAAEARAGAEDIARELPAAVMPMDAIERKRKRLAELDRMLREK
jgi:hypothetical protein